MLTMLKKTFWAVIIILLVIPPLLLKGYYLNVLLVAMALGIAYEIAHLEIDKYLFLKMIINFIAICSMGFGSYQILIAAFSLFLLLEFLLALYLKNYSSLSLAFNSLLVALVGIALNGLQVIYHLHMTHNFSLSFLGYILLACFMSDSFAYICGYFFGKHKLLPHVSPKKTWEGAFGGYFFSLLISFIYALYFLSEINLYILLFISILLPFVAQVGDLSFSLIKRHFAIKDFSHLIPYHGGLLDRIDSLIFCLILLNVLFILGGLAV